MAFSNLNRNSQLQRRDALIRRFLPLADGLARRFHRRFCDLLERDDLIQVARLSLVQAAERINDERTAPGYFKRCVNGGLAHHLRDRSRLVRLPARAQNAAPWQHLSLDAPLRQHGSAADTGTEPGLCRLDLLAAPESEATAETAAAAASELEQLLAQLQPRQAQALRLTLVDGHSLRQAARLLGVSAVTVCRERKQAIAQLRSALSASAPAAA